MAKLGPLALAAIAAAFSGWAKAADLPPAPSLPPASGGEEEFSGWYLRGDVGGGVNAASPKLEIAPGPLAGPIVTQSVFSPSLSPFGMVDVGAGYQFNPWFRVDGTLEYRGGASLQSLYTITDPASPYFGGPLQYADFYRANVASLISLLNG
jgi:opacity protein-like surface antigen